MTFGNYIYTDNTAEHRKAMIDQLINTSDKLEAGHLKAVEAASQLKTTIANLDFNEKDNWLKNELLNDLETTIRDNVQYDNMYYALDDIIAKSGNILSDPRVVGRLKSQQAYEQFINDTDKRTDISEDKKQWIKELNPYHYEDKIGENGEIIEGNKWVGKNKQPDVNYSDILIRAIKDVARPSMKANTRIVFTDLNNAEVDPITNPQAVASAYITNETGSSKEWVDKEQLSNAIESLIKGTPGVLNGIDDDYAMAQWYYNKNKVDTYGVTDGRGGFIGKEEFVSNKFKGGISAAAYSKITNKSVEKPNIKTAGRGGSGGVKVKRANELFTSQSSPTQNKIELYNNLDNKSNDAKNTISTIGTSLNPNYKFNPDDIDGSSKIIIDDIQSKVESGQMAPQQGAAAINSVKRSQEDANLAEYNKQALRKYSTRNMTGSEAKKYNEASNLIEHIGDNTLTTTNPFYREIVDVKNQIFKDDNGDVVQYVTRKLSQDKADKMKQWCKDNGINLRDYGISITGNSLTIPNDEEAVAIIGEMVYNTTNWGTPEEFREYKSKDGVSKFSGPGKGNLVEIYNQESTGNIYNTLSEFRPIGKTIKNARDYVEEKDKKYTRGEQTIVTSTPIYSTTDAGGIVMQANDDNNRYKDVAHRLNGMLANSDPRMFETYSYDKKTGNFLPLDTKERSEIKQNIITAARKEDIKYTPSYDAASGKSATLLAVPKYDKNGKDTGETLNYKIINLVDSQSSFLWEVDEDMKADGKISLLNARPGQKEYLTRESDFPSFGNSYVIGADNQSYSNQTVKIEFDGKEYNVDRTSAAKCMGDLNRCAMFKQYMQIGQQLDSNVVLEVVNRTADELANITGYNIDYIISMLYNDMGIKVE